MAVDAQGTIYLDNNQISAGLDANLVNHNVVSRSRDGGRTWTGPVRTPLLLSGAPKTRVSQVTELVGEAGPPGDRWSGITLADGYAYVTWSDGRNGSSLDAVLSRVSLELCRRYSG